MIKPYIGMKVQTTKTIDLACSKGSVHTIDSVGGSGSAFKVKGSQLFWWFVGG